MALSIARDLLLVRPSERLWEIERVIGTVVQSVSIICVGTKGVQRGRRKGRRDDARLGKHSEYSHTRREERRSYERMEKLSLESTDSRFHSSFEWAIEMIKAEWKGWATLKFLDMFQKFHKKGWSSGELISGSPWMQHFKNKYLKKNLCWRCNYRCSVGRCSSSTAERSETWLTYFFG